jgi:cytoskeletal protein CcmA (bactofilin family)
LEYRSVVDVLNENRDFNHRDLRRERSREMNWRSKGHGKGAEGAEFTGFLDRGVHFEGTLEASGIFRVDAHVKGNLLSTHSLVLGENARVEGQIEGNHVVISGKFDGVIFAKGRVEIQTKGVVTGEIHSPCLIIEPGGIFDGRCHMLAASEVTKPLTIPIRSVQK